MKTTSKTNLLLLVILFTASLNSTQAQSATANKNAYSNYVVENPNADADIKVVSDFVNATVSGDLDKAKSLLADNFKGFGPAPTDSSTADQVING